MRGGTYRSRPAASRENGRGASRAGPRLNDTLHNWGARHLQTFFYALGQMWRRPAAALMTAAVIGIALALPAGLHVGLKNVQHVLAGWDGATQVSLFLTANTDEASATDLRNQLEAQSGIAGVDYISRENALLEFRRLSGFGEALDALEENPLPAVLVVRPALSHNSPDQVEALLKEMRALPSVELAQLDMQWVKRLFALMEIGQRGVWVLAGLLSLAVLLVVGNTIRLSIQNRRDEIVVTKLIGGTDAFIRRPFLYTGFWYGLFGAIIAAVLVQASLAVLSGPVRDLAALYNSSFRLDALNAATAGLLLLSGTTLGLLGSWFAVGRHLRDIEPT
ncbi:permease-like cell division protein FtsX [Thiohalomonas denitrificans]|uniref:permease-like cell division protein FtsX n=1 Tax=Thiohalomonas denitrificans TaxID=415747 RepID=UPI0026F19B93|nr:permease-like cell division protein FtsX [Thiohalomonas denitrificans]